MDVIGLGAANMDLVFQVSRLPRKDDEVIASSLDFFSGGSASNFCVGVSRLGLGTGFLGLVGKDVFGDMLLEEFKKEKVDTSAVKRVTKSTGLLALALDKNGNRSMIASRGANSELSPSNINISYLSKAKWLHITSLAGEDSLKAFVKAAQTAKKNNMTVSLDPGCIMAEQGLKKLSPLLKNVDVLFPSSLEFKMLGNKVVNYVDTVVITKGIRGCTVITSESKVTIPAFKTKAVDTTGAGDAFAAGFVYSSLNGNSLEESALIGNACASFNVKKVGARTGMPTKKQIQSFMK